MKITKEWLEKKGATKAEIQWFCNQTETDGLAIVGKLMAEDNFYLANWLIVRLMEYKQYVSYAVFAAELSNKSPKNWLSSRALSAAKQCIENPSTENKKAAHTSVYDNFSAESAAAYSAASDDANHAAYAVALVVDAAIAKEGIKKKIIDYGISLLEGINK